MIAADTSRETQGKSLGQLLDEFARLRTENLEELRAWNLQPDDLAKRGRHPAFGAVSLSELLATWAAHDLTHLHQVSRIMAHQYRETVGPWSKYLGVLQCTGHSANGYLILTSSCCTRPVATARSAVAIMFSSLRIPNFLR